MNEQKSMFSFIIPLGFIFQFLITLLGQRGNIINFFYFSDSLGVLGPIILVSFIMAIVSLFSKKKTVYRTINIVLLLAEVVFWISIFQMLNF